LAVALLLVGLAAAAEIALAAVDRSTLRRQLEAGDRRAALLNTQMSDPAQFWLTVMLLKTLGVVAVGVAVGFMLLTHVDVTGVLVGIVLTWLALALAQIVVRSYVLRDPHGVALSLAPSLRIIMALFSPMTFLLYRTGLRLSGERHEDADESIFMSEDGLRLLMQVNEEESEIQESEKQMIASILEMNETVVREVMVPRIDMVTLEVNTDLQTALDVIIEAGHSRIPVYEGDVDVIVGVLYAKDLLKCFRDNRTDAPIRELLRPAYFIPATKKISALLREMQQQRTHLAIIVDEYGGIAGLVTFEDMLEEIVGDIQDEYDTHEQIAYQPIGEDAYLVSSRLDLDMLADLLDLDLSEEEGDTVGGLIYSHLEHVPEPGEVVELGGWRFTVLSVDGRRINQVRVERISPPPTGSAPAPDHAHNPKPVFNPSSVANQP
jgi:CBS domain containing-hemolysin-like protein